MERYMDNGNKIKISKPEVRLFLQGDLLPPEKDKPVSYDLEVEYAKTRKKKSPFVIIVMLCCIVTVGLLTFGVSKYIEHKNNTLSVGIEVFEDLNLKNLLDVVSRTENSLKQATNQKIQLETELASALKQAEVKRDSDIYLLGTLKMSKSERLRRTETVQNEYASAVNALHADYDPQLALYANQIEELKQQLASYDRKNIELAQEQEAAINSQRQLFELEKQQLASEYEQVITELRGQLASVQQELLDSQKVSIDALTKQYEAEISLLDPVFTDAQSAAVIRAVLGSGADGSEGADNADDADDADNASGTVDTVFSKDAYSLALSDEAVLQYADSVLTDVDARFSQFNRLAAAVSQVPWSNSLPEYVKAMTVLANTIGKQTVAATVRMLQSQDDVIVDQRQTISDLDSRLQSSASDMRQLRDENAVYRKAMNAFDALTRQNGDAGYILDTENPARMLVYISPLFTDSVRNGTRAYVFRASDKLIGMVTLERAGKFIYAIPDGAESAGFRPNDRILLELIK